MTAPEPHLEASAPAVPNTLPIPIRTAEHRQQPASAAAAPPSETETLIVRTSIGLVQGFVDASFPRVRQWLGIPFAERPVGNLRFAPPVAKLALAESQILSATTMPRAPMQAHTTKPDLYAKHVPEFLAAGPYSEDCLYLNVFAPRYPDPARLPLPTIVFFYGGQGEWGGINAEYSQPHSWVEALQTHIVVMFNYRVGVFGFPNARGLGQSPVGLLDQRLALEFVRQNISAFGGSPTTLIAWGHAAGGYSIDAHLFAWPDDPIIAGAICVAGWLPLRATDRDLAKESFSLLARRLGCAEDATPEEEVAFLRSVDAGAIQGCFRAYNDSDADTKLYFGPQRDDVFFFSPEEQLLRARAGKFAKIPMMVGMTADEGNGLASCLDMAKGSEAAAAAASQWTSLFESTLQQVIGYRVANGCTTYRFLYAGDFANISPRPWMKSYHFCELPIIMGTHEIERGPSSGFQRQLSQAMQEMWVNFANDPEKGLATRWGWKPASKENGYSPMVLGKQGVLLQQDKGCNQGSELMS